METQKPVTQNTATVDWLPSLFQAIGSVFDTVSSALEPSVLSAQAYFQQVLQAQSKLQDPLAQYNEQQQRTDTILIYAGVGIIVLLLVVILLKKQA